MKKPRKVKEMSKTILDKISEGRQIRRNDMRPEFRTVDSENEKLIVEGHACTFNEPYVLYKDSDYEVCEQIDRNAFAECDMSDVIMQFDHAGRVFARTRNNTLEVGPDNIGLFIRADLSKSSGGPDLYADIKSGVIDRMSFAFTVIEDKREVTEDRGSGITTVLRTITKIGKLYDVSAVSIPANDGTDISARNFGDGVIAEIKAERLKVQENERRKARLKLKLKMSEMEDK